MAHCNTIFLQLLKLVSRHEFETLAKQHHTGRSFRTASRWSQFVVMMMAQLTGRSSLRDKPGQSPNSPPKIKSCSLLSGAFSC